MTIRERFDDAVNLYHSGRYEGSLISTLIAIAGAARRHFPRPIQDNKAFADYIEEQTGHILECIVTDQKSLTVGEVFYKFYRCNLIHEAELPANIILDVNDPGCTIRPALPGWSFSLGWLFKLWEILIQDRVLRPQFDDLRDTTPLDLIYTGSNICDFIRGIERELCVSPGRQTLIMNAMFAAGWRRLQCVSEGDLQLVWNNEILKSPERYNLEALKVLTTCGPCADSKILEKIQQQNMPSFLVAMGRQDEFTTVKQIDSDRHEITATGLKVSRMLLDHFHLSD